MSNPFFSYDIGTALLALFIIVVWAMVIAAVVGVYARLALTVLAAFVILWVVGQADEVLDIVVGIFTGTWDVLVKLWSDIFR